MRARRVLLHVLAVSVAVLMPVILAHGCAGAQPVPYATVLVAGCDWAGAVGRARRPRRLRQRRRQRGPGRQLRTRVRVRRARPALGVDPLRSAADLAGRLRVPDVGRRSEAQGALAAAPQRRRGRAPVRRPADLQQHPELPGGTRRRRRRRRGGPRRRGRAELGAVQPQRAGAAADQRHHDALPPRPADARLAARRGGPRGSKGPRVRAASPSTGTEASIPGAARRRWPRR